MSMRKIFCPHRGSSTTMLTTKINTILPEGELFIEYPDVVTGDNQYKIKIGNGVDTYANLKYAINPAAASAATESITTSLNDTINLLGAKNLLPNGATSAVMNGVTFIVNSDGSITANGTSTAAFSFNIFDETYPGFEKIVRENFLNKRLIVTGCPEGGHRDTYSMNLYRVGSVDGSDVTISERGTGYSFTWLNDLSGIKPIVRILIRENVEIPNLTFRPMIRLATIDDPTYVPYAMTNKQLTDNLLKVYVKEISIIGTVLAGQDIILGNISVVSDGKIGSYLDCLGLSLINSRGSLGYDGQAMIYLTDTGDVVITPWVGQDNPIFRLTFLYY